VLQKVDMLERKLLPQSFEQTLAVNDSIIQSVEKQHVAIEVHKVLADTSRRKKCNYISMVSWGK